MWKQLPYFQIVSMRPRMVSPAHVHAHGVAGNPLQGIV